VINCVKLLEGLLLLLERLELYLVNSECIIGRIRVVCWIKRGRIEFGMNCLKEAAELCWGPSDYLKDLLG